jgi:hypothetical protein
LNKHILATLKCEQENFFHHCSLSSLRCVGVCRHRASSSLVGSLVGADSSARDCAATSLERGFPARGDGVADRRDEPMELCSVCYRTSTPDHGALLFDASRAFRLGRFVCARNAPARIAIFRFTGFASLLGDIRTATLPHRFVSISGKVGVAREETFYTRTGDWFAWLCIAVFVSLLAFQLFSRAKHPHDRRIANYDAVALAGIKSSGSLNLSRFRSSWRSSRRLTHI